MYRYLGVTLLIFVSASAMANSVPSVEIDQALRQESDSTMTVSGVIVSRQDALISSELAGRLLWIAEVGDRISAGDPLAGIDDHLLLLDQRNAQADISRLEANLAWLDRQGQRLKKLAATNNTAQSELDEVRSRHAMLEQELTAARVELERRNYNLERAIVQAPFDGVVVSREAAAGEYTESGRALLRLVNTAAAEVSVTAPLRLARFVAAGDRVMVHNQDQRGISTVRSLVPVGDIRSHMMELRVSLDNETWLIGEPVSVALPDTRRTEHITVDRDALVLRNNDTYVFTVDEALLVHRVSVVIGRGEGQRITVSGELDAGDRVVVRGGERLQDGQTVAIIEERLSSAN